MNIKFHCLENSLSLRMQLVEKSRINRRNGTAEKAAFCKSSSAYIHTPLRLIERLKRLQASNSRSAVRFARS